jgi:hypothetical protein
LFIPGRDEGITIKGFAVTSISESLFLYQFKVFFLLPINLNVPFVLANAHLSLTTPSVTLAEHHQVHAQGCQ